MRDASLPCILPRWLWLGMNEIQSINRHCNMTSISGKKSQILIGFWNVAPLSVISRMRTFSSASWGCMREPKKPGCWTWRKDTVQATYELCILHFRHQRNDERNFLPIREPVRTTARLATVRQHAEPGSSHQTHTTDDENSSCDSFDRWSAKPLTSCVYQAYSISLGA